MSDGDHRADPLVATDAGRLRGVWSDGVAVFRGVPFATPPVGPDRWRPPRPPEPWRDDRPARCFGPAPLQPQPKRNSLMYLANFADRRSLTMSEDCLYLNVWTPEPAPDAALPVMVWLHGGGNRFGYGSQDIHDGRNLARRGVVVVTLNYRLGALGFLAHPELSRENDGASGNYGLLDAVAALRWVARNIGGFGGDPAAVTLAGNSAGAALVCHLMAAPAAHGLFAKAIGQSSSGIDRADGELPSLESAERRGADYGQSLGAPALAALRALSGVELSATGHFGPVVDTVLIPVDTGTAFRAGTQTPVPLLVGWNRDEGSVYAQPRDLAELESRAGAVPSFDQVYPVGSDETGHRSARRYVGESRFGWPVWRWAQTHARTSGATTWVYQFDHEPPLPPDVELLPPADGGDGYGVFHTAELPYMWDNLETRAWPWQPVDRELARAMADAWVRFISSGDPNGDGLPPWPALTAGPGQRVMQLAEHRTVAEPDRLEAMDFLDRVGNQG